MFSFSIAAGSYANFLLSNEGKFQTTISFEATYTTGNKQREVIGAFFTPINIVRQYFQWLEENVLYCRYSGTC